MRRNRLILYGLWILSLVGISFYGGPVSYGFFFACTLVPVISILYLWYVYGFFKIYQRLDNNTPTVNTPVGYYFSLRNESFLTFSHIRVLFYSTFSNINELSDDIVYELMPGSGVTRETTATLKYRGEYEVGIKSVVIRDFFNLFTVTYKNRETLRVKVKPRLIDTNDIFLEQENVASIRENNFMDSIRDILVREYVPGDDMRSINWKTSARIGRLFVHNRIGEQNRAVTVLFDGGRYSDDLMDFIPLENKVLETALAITMYYVQKNTPVIIATNRSDSIVGEVNSFGDYEHFYERMCAFFFMNDGAGELSYEYAMRPDITGRSLITYLITEKWDMRAREAAFKLNNDGIPVVALVIDEGAKQDDSLNQTRIISMGPDDDLREVLR